MFLPNDLPAVIDNLEKILSKKSLVFAIREDLANSYLFPGMSGLGASSPYFSTSGLIFLESLTAFSQNNPTPQMKIYEMMNLIAMTLDLRFVWVEHDYAKSSGSGIWVRDYAGVLLLKDIFVTGSFTTKKMKESTEEREGS